MDTVSITVLFQLLSDARVVVVAVVLVLLPHAHNQAAPCRSPCVRVGISPA